LNLPHWVRGSGCTRTGWGPGWDYYFSGHETFYFLAAFDL
jgi:hypothetical protein